ncbi:hypothetical protein L211DRAFT_197590 [Terfezia boudieri ATCC MYA-4762]|uniref:Uncharacterized protein n=1 Tax=Terfezia boudieri ATCC MYA-4762 TaxID=1051890 RepID=A0A3N4LTJ6_9PEZI|nr:hypothetical protein L211DRAFT_197590 [Terfezia boudieri ATCC MYA-4762]
MLFLCTVIMSPSPPSSPLPVKPVNSAAELEHQSPSSVTIGTWTRPKTNSGKRPSKKELSDSMGIDESAYGFLMSLATNALSEQIQEKQHLVDTNRWSNVHGDQKVEVYEAFSQKVANTSQTRPDFNQIKECLKDEGIVNYFTQEGWVLARKRWKNKNSGV